MIAFFVWCGRAWVRSLASADSFDRRVGVAAGIAIALVSLHSLWEYPLRTIALSTLFGLCCALLIAVARADDLTCARSQPKAGFSLVGRTDPGLSLVLLISLTQPFALLLARERLAASHEKGHLSLGSRSSR